MYDVPLESENLEADCPLVPPLSKPCSVPVLPCCHGVMVLGRYGAAVWWQSEVRWLSQPPSPSLSVRLAGRNQTFTAGAPAAVVLLPQLINNGHPIVEQTWEGQDQESGGIH